ncbi:hypothetical protein AUN02_02935 [Cronobacter sakazakii]|uniref:hypothetical protein n=1 Tax=Cronobacter sakazakii TaxID=28141 RepID=UPI000B4BE34A|nr:hypothetical protein [Cronobacter sakazakii]PUW12503.1 hypothetical protein AUM95_08690 [Cronobacter sakazakii]PUW32953.1 hypothetical protein AUN03_10620 [Cronobacter sakazakii]PUW34299.1 hypothetical protein AUN02_02935 [Cronobacter sakazakii]PUW36748.1 hypothetical protein AUN04_10425 [Cronobacter sakazakii]PUW53964.1 hypothetical protein AUM94_19880 [Cronobacter sakazakii]
MKKILFTFLSAVWMFFAGNTAKWLPQQLESLGLPDWVHANVAPILIVYGLASGINFLILKKFVFEKEIASDYQALKKEKRNLCREGTKKDKLIKKKTEECNHLNEKYSKLKIICDQLQAKIIELKSEVESLENSIEIVYGQMHDQVKRYGALKRQSEVKGKQYNPQDTSSGAISDDLQQYNTFVKNINSHPL